MPSLRVFSLSRTVLAALAVLVGLMGADTAHATTFQFAIPATTVVQALTSNLTSPNLPEEYAFYEIYIRPALPSEPGAASNPTNLALQSDVPPIVSGNDAWVATTGQALGDGMNSSFKFTVSPSATILSLVTSNPNVNGKTIDGLPAQQMPGTNVFQIFFTSTAPLLTNNMVFKVFGRAYKFEDGTAEEVATKGVLLSGYFNYTGNEVPEPASLLSMGGGSLVLAIFLKRRRAATGTGPKLF